MSNISKKRSLKVSEQNLQRVIDKIYDDMNEIIDATNQGETKGEKQEFSGKEGDIRIVKKNNNYQIQGRTSDGWAKADITLID
tara:strand:- start:12147 stop:12395 length:249 start_codon:yes stop_codon:yes gene_type:complete